MWVGGNLEQVKRNFALLPCLSQGLLNMQPLQMLSSGPLMGAAATRLSSVSAGSFFSTALLRQ